MVKIGEKGISKKLENIIGFFLKIGEKGIQIKSKQVGLELEKNSGLMSYKPMAMFVNVAVNKKGNFYVSTTSTMMGQNTERNFV